MTHLEQAREAIMEAHAILTTNRVSDLRAAHVNELLTRLNSAHQAIMRHEDRAERRRKTRRALLD